MRAAKNELQKVAKALAAKGNKGLSKRLAKLRFDPLRQLTNYVYPQLEAKEQAQILLALLSFQYSKPKAHDGTTPRRSRGVQNNIQINVPENSSDSVDLVTIASQKLPGE